MSRMDADVFRDFRRRHKMSQRDLARVLGVHRRTVENIESGKFRLVGTTRIRFDNLVAKHKSQGEHDAHRETDRPAAHR